MNGMLCYDHIMRQLCPEGHCASPDEFKANEHDPASVNLADVPPAVTVYHGRALCLECVISYVAG